MKRETIEPISKEKSDRTRVAAGANRGGDRREVSVGGALTTGPAFIRSFLSRSALTYLILIVAMIFLAACGGASSSSEEEGGGGGGGYDLAPILPPEPVDQASIGSTNRNGIRACFVYRHPGWCPQNCSVAYLRHALSDGSGISGEEAMQTCFISCGDDTTPFPDVGGGGGSKPDPLQPDSSGDPNIFEPVGPNEPSLGPAFGEDQNLSPDEDPQPVDLVKPDAILGQNAPIGYRCTLRLPPLYGPQEMVTFCSLTYSCEDLPVF